MIPVAAFHYDLIAHIASSLGVRSFLEIGVKDGGSFLATVKAAPQLSKVIACDTWGGVHGGSNRGSHAHIDAALDELGYRGARIYLDGPSAEMVAEYALTDASAVDLAHVDGDHSEAGALADLRAVWSLVRRVLVVHDVFMPPVWAAVAQFAGERKDEIGGLEIGVDGTGTAVLWRAT